MEMAEPSCLTVVWTLACGLSARKATVPVCEDLNYRSSGNVAIAASNIFLELGGMSIYQPGVGTVSSVSR